MQNVSFSKENKEPFYMQSRLWILTNYAVTLLELCRSLNLFSTWLEGCLGDSSKILNSLTEQQAGRSMIRLAVRLNLGGMKWLRGTLPSKEIFNPFLMQFSQSKCPLPAKQLFAHREKHRKRKSIISKMLRRKKYFGFRCYIMKLCIWYSAFSAFAVLLTYPSVPSYF